MISDFVNPFETYRDVDAPHRPVSEPAQDDVAMIFLKQKQINQEGGSMSVPFSGNHQTESSKRVGSNENDSTFSMGQLKNQFESVEEIEDKLFATYGLNGDVQHRDKIAGIVRLEDSRHNIFGRERLGEVKRIEVWTFERRVEGN